MSVFDPSWLSAAAALIAALSGWLLGSRSSKQKGADITRQAVESAQAFWATTLTAQQQQLDRQQTQIDRWDIEKREREREAFEQQRAYDRMLTHLESIHSWIERGMRPPPPERPEWLQPGPFSPRNPQLDQPLKE